MLLINIIAIAILQTKCICRILNHKNMSASIYTEKFVEPDNKMLTYDLADTKIYLDKIGSFIKIWGF